MEGKHNLFKLFFIRHLKACITSIDKIIRKPIASLMTIGVVGIALVLPASLEVLLQNVKLLSKNFDQGVQVSLYLRNNVSSHETQHLIQHLQANPNIAEIKYISPEQGLLEFQKASGFGNVLSGIGENPLPPVIVLKPHLVMQTPAKISAFLETIKKQPEIDNVRLDMEWVKRLYYIFELGLRVVDALFALFGFAIVLVIGNTIRLSLQDSRKEMHLLKLLGASNAFVRRPFLYTGMFYGLFGALFAWFLANLLIWFLSESVSKLAASYNSNFYLHNLSIQEGVILILIGMFLGLIGSWLASLRAHV